jgi:hypothetical protein
MKKIPGSDTSTNLEKRLLLGVLFFFFLFIIFRSNSVLSWGAGNNYRNFSVRSTVNVTNAYPEILNVTCSSPGASLTLNAGTTKQINCSVQIRDYNGGGDINYVNGTFYYYLNQTIDPDDNNTHYSNASCVNITSSGYYTNWTCSFNVWYYALNGTWTVNATVNDTWGAKSTRGFNYTSISALLAINATSTINFGNLAVTETSNLIEAQVMNFGNVPINVTVAGFGGDNSSNSSTSAVAMICEMRNISFSNERYSLDGAAAYVDMTSITSTSVTIPDLTVQKQTLSDTFVTNSTYWRLHVNLSDNPFGVCNGSVVFSAISP